MVEEGMMPYVSYSLVVRDPESCESLREGLDHLLRSLKEELDLFFLYEGREDPSPDVVMHVWWEPQHTKLDVRLVCDAPLAASYVNVTAPDKEQAVAVLGAIAARLPARSLEALRDKAKASDAEADWTLFAIAICDPAAEPNLTVFRDAFRSPRPARRRAAAQAAAIVASPSLLPLLAEALAAEAHGSTCTVLEIALVSCAEMEDPG
jgi:hypothetical protein